MTEMFLKELQNNNISFSLGEPMAEHTTFRIGGKADVYITVNKVEELKNILSCAKKNDVPYFCIGKGSNLLVSDKGIEGAVIRLCGLDEIRTEGEEIICGAGLPLSSLCSFACENSLAGLEFAYGIPGSVGGALYMNAGAYGGEMAQVVSSARCIDKDGNEIELSAKDMELGYRTSVFKSNGLIITELSLELKRGEKQEISAKMKELLSRRKEKQPLEYPSAGSTFRRPEGYYAGALIEQNGLKGFSVGGACVSEKHAGFVINKNNATAKDVKQLVKEIQRVVYEKNGVLLEPEIIFIGRE